MDSELHKGLTAMLNAMQAAERDVFGGLSPAVRDTAAADGGWSPKDVQAHLSGWKLRQGNRLAAARRGEEVETLDAAAVDNLNAAMQATRADWKWDAISAEADAASDELASQVAATPEAVLLTGRLLEATFANGPYHTLEHLAATARAHGGTERVNSYARELRRMAARGDLPATVAGALIYNVACFYALGGQLEDARQLLPEAFRLRPDLREWAIQDSDLTALGGQWDLA
jgi:hypothetical protein